MVREKSIADIVIDIAGYLSLILELTGGEIEYNRYDPGCQEEGVCVGGGGGEGWGRGHLGISRSLNRSYERHEVSKTLLKMRKKTNELQLYAPFYFILRGH